MLEHDILAAGTPDKPRVSFGPRRVVDGWVESTPSADASFWGVYRHDADGHAELIGDAVDRYSAERFAELASRCAP